MEIQVNSFTELKLSEIFPNPSQPRKQFDDIEGLASTIKEHGLLQPITVVKKFDGYMIISGERRYKAHLYNEAKTIKAHIVDVSEEQVEELTLIENIQRNDLTDFELAKHICKLWESGRYEKKSDLAARIGKKDSFVSKSFNCLKLDSEIIDHIEQNKTPISIGVMDEIARVKDKDTQKEVFEKYNNKEITRDEIKEFKEPKKTIKEKVEEIFIKPPISCNYVEENSPRENNTIRDKTKQKNGNFHGVYDYKDYVSSYGKVETNIKCFARTLVIGDVLTFNFSSFSEKDELKSKTGKRAKITEITEMYSNLRVVFDGDKKETYILNENIGYAKTLNNIEINPKKFEQIILKEEYQDLQVKRLKQKIQELEKEVEELNNKEVFIVGYREKKGSGIGSGFRCRALNENEAIEIAKKENYHNVANDKNIIWEARTLKSSCNSENIFNDWIGYGFGTVNDMGTYLSICQGDFEGTITFSKNGDFIQTTNNDEYQIIIKELTNQKMQQRVETKQSNDSQVQEPIKDDESITIKSLELNDNDVTIEYSNNEHEYISYSKAKKIIKEVDQEYIKYVNNGSENACNFINSLPRNVSIYGAYIKKKYEF